MELFSNSFSNHELIPAKYTCDGENISPQIYWQNVPADTKSFVLIVDDPDAPIATWVHWILYNLPPDIRSIDENIRKLPQDAEVGLNSWGKQEYGGPCPPSSQHRYFFKLYALDGMLNLTGKIDSKALQKAMNGHILAEAKLIGLYR